jgi:hypothetical protein
MAWPIYTLSGPDAIADRMLDLERYFRENRASLHHQ